MASASLRPSRSKTLFAFFFRLVSIRVLMRLDIAIGPAFLMVQLYAICRANERCFYFGTHDYSVVRWPSHNARPWRAGVAGGRLCLGCAVDRAHAESHLDAQPEGAEHRDEPVNREASEVDMANRRGIGCGDAGQGF